MLKRIAHDYLIAVKQIWWLLCFLPFAAGLLLAVLAIFMAHGTRAPAVMNRIFQLTP